MSLAACSPDSQPLPPIDQALESCPERFPAPQPPGVPRTIDTLARWGNAGIAAWNGTAQALALCDQRRARAVELLKLYRAALLKS